MKHGLSILFSLLLISPALAERINHEGRLLGPLPVVTNAILFNTTNADAVVALSDWLGPDREPISARAALERLGVAPGDRLEDVQETTTIPGGG